MKQYKMIEFKFKQVKNDKYHFIINAENEEIAREQYKENYGKYPDN